jgi:hypothetical protein
MDELESEPSSSLSMRFFFSKRGTTFLHESLNGIVKNQSCGFTFRISRALGFEQGSNQLPNIGPERELV